MEELRLSGTKGLYSAKVRNTNLALVAHHIVYSSDPCSRAAISEITGLDRSTVTRLAEALLRAKLVREGEPLSGGASGRPSVPLLPNPGSYAAIGVDVLKGEIVCYAIDIAGKALYQCHVDRSHLTEPEKVLDLVEQVVHTVKELLVKQGTKVCGVGIGFAGIVDNEASKIFFLPNHSWRDVDLKKQFSASFDSTMLEIGNGTTYAAKAEAVSRMKKGLDHQLFIFVMGDDGIGAACVQNGQVLKGNHRAAGEIGHTPFGDPDLRCNCGAFGCLETVCSKTAIYKNAGLDLDVSTSSLNRKYSKGDRSVTQALDLAAQRLGLALASYVNLADIRKIVFGGFFGELFECMEPALTDKISSHVLCFESFPVELEVSEMGPDAGAKGAAWNVLDRVVQDPSRWIPELRGDRG